MRKAVFVVGLILIVLSSCQSYERQAHYKIQILRTESNFALMAEEVGIEEAFLHFAAEEAVLNRNDTLIEGKLAIKKYFEAQPYEEVRLKWEPDFVDVSSSGDLAYTYGKYVFRAIDTTGQLITANGIFHTVWKRQEDGSWKFVYD